MCSCKKNKNPKQLYNGNPIPVIKGYDQQPIMKLLKIQNRKNNKTQWIKIERPLKQMGGYLLVFKGR